MTRDEFEEWLNGAQEEALGAMPEASMALVSWVRVFGTHLKGLALSEMATALEAATPVDGDEEDFGLDDSDDDLDDDGAS